MTDQIVAPPQDDNAWWDAQVAQSHTGAPSAAPTANATPSDPDSDWWEKQTGQHQPPPPVAKPPVVEEPKPHEFAFMKGFIGQSNRLLELIERTAGQSATGLAMAEDPAHADLAPQMQEQWYKNFVEPTVQNQAQFELPPDASFTDKAFHGLGATAGFIADAIATGGAAAEGATASLAARGAPAIAARAAGGATMAQIPAASTAISVGNEVYKQTGDAHAAKVAGVTSYLTGVASASVPMGVGGRLLTRVGTAAGAGVGIQEASRMAQNAGMPEDMQQPHSFEEDALAAITTAPFGVLGGGRGARPPGPLVEQAREVHENVIPHAQEVAAREAAAQGGDGLKQVLAAAEVGATLGAHHDAAAYEMHMETRNAQVAEETLRQQESEAQLARDQNLNAVEKEREQYNQAAQPTQDEAFAAREKQVAAGKERDFAAAEGQREEQLGQQRQETEEALNTGAQKGGLLEPNPTLADTLTPEQRNALMTLSQRRQAEAAAPTPTLAERRAQAASEAEAARTKEEEAFTPLPPEQPQVAPQTPETLAARRQADLDAAMAAKIGRPALRQGYDPAEALIQSQAREDMETAQRVENNASGESNASQEAVNRVRDEAKAGITRWQIDPDGNATQLRGVDAVDAKAPQGSVIVSRDANGKTTILDRGGLPQLHANGLVARAQGRGQFKDIGHIGQDIGRQLQMTKTEAASHIGKLDLPPDRAAGITVHDFHAQDNDPSSTVPPHIRQEAIDQNHLNARGVFDPANDQVHIFAPAHETGDIDELHDTAIHELMHQGIRRTLGDSWGNVMDDVARAAPQAGKAWMKDYASQHGLDMKNPMHRAHVADEYGVHLALDNESNPTLWQRIVDAVRSGLSKIGIGRYMPDDEIRDLVLRSNNGLGKVRSDIGSREQSSGLRWADAKESDVDNLHPSDPESIAEKFGRTVEEQAGSGPSYLRSRLQLLKDWGTRANVATMGPRLAWLHLDSLPDMISPQKMGAPRQFVRTVGQMEGRKGQLMDAGNALALKWSRWENGGIFRDPETGKLTTQAGNEEGGKTLRDLMHASTIAGVDPSRDYQPMFGDNATPDQAAVERRRAQFHKDARDQYNSLDDQGRQLYNQVRDYYQERRADVLRGLEARINETGADQATKKQAMAELRRAFEGGTVKGPYFPLARFGDMWAAAKDPESGEYSFSRFEDPIQRKRWIQRAQEAGLNVEAGTKMDNKALMERVNPDFVKNIMAATEGNPELQDEIWQHYLKAMPEMSMRKALIHRKNVMGYSEDALRAFAYNAFHSAHQIARLEYGNRLDNMVGAMKREADAVSTSDPQSSDAHWAPALAKEFESRLDWIKNPRSSSMASGLTKLGFLWYIGASPATAIRISTQNSMLAQPYLGSKWGQLNASRELTSAVMQWARTKGNLGDSLRGNERAMFDEARARGTFSSTSAQTLAAGGADRPIGTGPLDAFNRVTGFMFNAMEHKNRMTTALAAYRLGRQAGLDHEEATEQAIDASNKAHFNYSNYNRPRVLQNDFAKVAGLFKQYPWQVTDRLARSFRDGVMRNPDLTPDQRDQQLRAFAGYMGKMMLFAGLKGVPILYHATMAAINTAFGDKDKPFDAQAALRAHLEDHLGKTGSDAVMDGPMSALTGAALSNGASYADLWYKNPARDMNWRDQAADLLGQLAGPVYGFPLEAGTGLDIAHQGDLERGAEHFTPPMVNHALKTYRLATQGVQNLRGEQVVSPEELGEGWSTPLVGNQVVRQKNLLLQAIGFSPEVVSRQYEANTSRTNFKTEIEQRQNFLTEQYDNAVLRGDNEGAIKWMQQMQQFHTENPGLAWSGRGLQNGIRMRAKSAAMAEHGVNMKPGEAAEYEQMLGRQPQ